MKLTKDGIKIAWNLIFNGILVMWMVYVEMWECCVYLFPMMLIFVILNVLVNIVGVHSD